MPKINYTAAPMETEDMSSPADFDVWGLCTPSQRVELANSAKEMGMTVTEMLMDLVRKSIAH